MDQPQPVVADEAPVANEIRRYPGCVAVRSQHGRDEVVIGVGLVYKTSASAVDGEKPRLRTVEYDMRKDRSIPIALAHDRTRHPESGALKIGDDLAANIFRCRKPVTTVRIRR